MLHCGRKIKTEGGRKIKGQKSDEDRLDTIHCGEMSVKCDVMRCGVAARRCEAQGKEFALDAGVDAGHFILIG